MKTHLIGFCVIALLITISSYGQKVTDFIEAKSSSIAGEKFGLVRLSRKNEHIKVKYFATNADGVSVYQRYQTWATNKNVVAVSSGTYMDNCENPSKANPIGLCIDQGEVMNRSLVSDKLDALVIVYATGGMAASDLTKGNLKVTYQDKTEKTLNIRNVDDKLKFMKWAADMEATVFQTHLFIYQNVIKIATNSSQVKQGRRFLAVCKQADGQIAHYMLNLPTPSTLYNGITKAEKILKELEEVDQIVFMINLDTGCQDVFSVFDENNRANTNPLLKGAQPLTSAVNLLAYYYE